MIPVFNCATFLRQTLESVLAQGFGPEEMQIEVVDDCSTKDDPEAVVREIGAGRVAFYRKPKNEGATANFNTCVARSRGHLIHILHGDDYLMQGFYKRIRSAADDNLGTALIACRSFVVDEQGIIIGVGARLMALESPSRKAESFFYETPIVTPGVVVRRSFYEEFGGFMPALVHTADCEMWSRAVGVGGGMVTADVLACYRQFDANDTGRLIRTAENLRDIERLNRIMVERYPGFDPKRGLRRVCEMALIQAAGFSTAGDSDAREANLQFFSSHASAKLHARRVARFAAKKMLG